MAWEKGSMEITNLFEKVKEAECSRRMNLREFLVAFVQRQERLFLGIPSVQNNVLETLVAKEMSREEIDGAVEGLVKEGVAKYEKSSGKKAPSLDSQSDEPEVALESPLHSELLCKCKIVERTSAGVNKGWRTSLAVMTTDSYLHFFDLSALTNLNTEAALKALIPNATVPTGDNVKLGNANFKKGWSDSICPTESLFLANCSLLQRDLTSFEISERVNASNAATKMIRKKIAKRVLINTPTKEETNDWIAALTL